MKIDSKARNSLLSAVERFPRQRLVLLGDLVADEFIYGEIARVSREAPVLILKQRERRIVPGGGANAANNLADLGAQVTPVGIVGEDEVGEALLHYFEQKGVSTRLVARLPNYLTPTKSRILGGITHWQSQQIVRVDRVPSTRPGAKVQRQLSQSIVPLLRKASALLVSDYGYGTTGGREVDFLRRYTGSKKVPVTVDSRFDLTSFKRVTAATPNEPEVEEAFGVHIENKMELLHQLGKKALERQKLEALLVTRGRDGMVLFERQRPPQHLPIFGSDQAVDVTGAGDTVIAAFTLALAAGSDFLHAAMLANIAGGLVVMKRGTATVTGEEIKEAIRNA